MRRPDVSLDFLASIAFENPRRQTEGLWDYLDRLCVLAGVLKPGEGRLPKDYAFNGTDVERAGRSGLEPAVARLPYRDE